MTFAPAVSDILDLRQMSVDVLAERADVGLSRLRSAIERGASLNDDEVVAVAATLAVPVAALFSKKAPTLSSVPDFRKSTPRPGLYHQGTLNALSYVEKISGALASLNVDCKLHTNFEKFNGVLNKRNAVKLAAEWREDWGISDDEQLSLKSSNDLYKHLRAFIEGMGVAVVHRSFKNDEVAGLYCRVSDGPHVIVINTTSSSKARKLFTLAHELCHVIIGEVGASNPSVTNNKIEIFCNQFAAHLLAPESLLRLALRGSNRLVSASDDSIRLFAAKVGISQEACILRLVDIDVLDSGDYARWKSRFKGLVPPGDQSDGQGGGGGDPIQNKRTTYGSTLLKKISEAKRLGAIEELDVSRVFGIKPKYQKDLLGV